MIPNIGLFDVCLGILVLLTTYFIAFRLKDKISSPTIPFNYFLLSLSSKFIGAITFVLLSIFYYKSGDTFLYFEIAEELRNHLFTNFSETVHLLITPYDGLEKLAYHPLQVYHYHIERSTTWVFSRIVFFFNLISFGSYLVSSLLMGLVSFLGLWLGYKSINHLYPTTSKLMLIPFFGIPTALIWSSGILKDTLLMGIIGWLLFIGVQLFIKKKAMILNSLSFIVCLLLLISLKPILVITFIPCFIFWGMLHFTSVIKNINQRFLFRIGFVTLIFTSIVTISNQLPETSKYKFDKLTLTLITYQLDHSRNKGANTNYSLGAIKYNNLSIAKKIPKAINVTFFRPYLWESKNLPSLFAALESLTLLLSVIFVLLKTKLSFFKNLFSDKNMLFFFFFAILYATISGLTAYNFGALSRFKIPAILFLGIGFVISLNIHNNKSFKNH